MESGEAGDDLAGCEEGNKQAGHFPKMTRDFCDAHRQLFKLHYAICII